MTTRIRAADYFRHAVDLNKTEGHGATATQMLRHGKPPLLLSNAQAHPAPEPKAP